VQVQHLGDLGRREQLPYLLTDHQIGFPVLFKPTWTVWVRSARLLAG
jgi:hypothetical protein